MEMRANCNLDKFLTPTYIIACAITSPARSRHIHPAQNIRERHARFAEPNKEEEDSGFDKRTAKTANPKLGENRRK